MNASAVGNGCEIGGMEREYMRRHHRHEVAENQCSSALVKHIRAPVPLVIPLDALGVGRLFSAVLWLWDGGSNLCARASLCKCLHQ